MGGGWSGHFGLEFSRHVIPAENADWDFSIRPRSDQGASERILELRQRAAARARGMASVTAANTLCPLGGAASRFVNAVETLFGRRGEYAEVLGFAGALPGG